MNRYQLDSEYDKFKNNKKKEFLETKSKEELIKIVLDLWTETPPTTVIREYPVFDPSFTVTPWKITWGNNTSCDSTMLSGIMANNSIVTSEL